MDQAGEFYTFEKGVEKTEGGKGFADVWYRDHFAIEYKGKHKDLSAAYRQLQQYQGALENPPLLVVTDIERFEINTNFTGTVTRVYSFTNEELPEPENLRLLRAMFEKPYSLKPTRTVESVTEEAAGKFAKLADGLRARGVESQEAAHFLNKLLFCLFAEDIGRAAAGEPVHEGGGAGPKEAGELQPERRRAVRRDVRWGRVRARGHPLLQRRPVLRRRGGGARSGRAEGAQGSGEARLGFGRAGHLRNAV